MPCPLFRPEAPVGELNPGVTPLGDLFRGKCAADSGYVIPLEILRCCCNFGYAKEQCELAKQAEADSSSLVISKIEPASVQVRWSLERDHHPVAAGEITVARAEGKEELPRDPIEAQARAYVSVYRRRTGASW